MEADPLDRRVSQVTQRHGTSVEIRTSLFS
jgi:hypothetical protein